MHWLRYHYLFNCILSFDQHICYLWDGRSRYHQFRIYHVTRRSNQRQMIFGHWFRWDGHGWLIRSSRHNIYNWAISISCWMDVHGLRLLLTLFIYLFLEFFTNYMYYIFFGLFIENKYYICIHIYNCWSLFIYKRLINLFINIFYYYWDIKILYYRNDCQKFIIANT